MTHVNPRRFQGLHRYCHGIVDVIYVARHSPHYLGDLATAQLSVGGTFVDHFHQRLKHTLDNTRQSHVDNHRLHHVAELLFDSLRSVPEAQISVEPCVGEVLGRFFDCGARYLLLKLTVKFLNLVSGVACVFEIFFLGLLVALLALAALCFGLLPICLRLSFEHPEAFIDIAQIVRSESFLGGFFKPRVAILQSLYQFLLTLDFFVGALYLPRRKDVRKPYKHFRDGRKG